MREVKRKLTEFYGIVKENDEVYHNAARDMGLSDCCFWILYFLSYNGNEMTQRDLCAGLYIPKQTIGSAIKKLESEGYITLTDGENDRRSKPIKLTEKGELLAAETVDKVIAAELEAMSDMTEKEWQTFIKLSRKFTDKLKNNVRRLDFSAT